MVSVLLGLLHSLVTQQTFVEHCYIPGMILDSEIWCERNNEKSSPRELTV